jgi:hypothetical protein
MHPPCTQIPCFARGRENDRESVQESRMDHGSTDGPYWGIDQAHEAQEQKFFLSAMIGL